MAGKSSAQKAAEANKAAAKGVDKLADAVRKQQQKGGKR